jgi:hypothetical protein
MNEFLGEKANHQRVYIKNVKNCANLYINTKEKEKNDKHEIPNYPGEG